VATIHLRGPDVLVIGWIPFFLNNPPAPRYPPGLSTTMLFQSGNPDPPIAFSGYDGFNNWNYPGLLVGTKEYRAAVYLQEIEAKFYSDGSPPEADWGPSGALPGYTPLRTFAGSRNIVPNNRLMPAYSAGHGPAFTPRSSSDPAGAWVEVSYRAEFKLSWLPNVFARVLTGFWAPYAWCEIFYRFNKDKTVSIRVEGSAIPNTALYVDWKIPATQKEIDPVYSMLGASQNDVLGFIQTAGWGCKPAPRRPGSLTWAGQATVV
jgi:hypothetical protein